MAERKRSGLIVWGGGALVALAVALAGWDWGYKTFNPHGYYGRNIGKIAYNETSNLRVGRIVEVAERQGVWGYMVRDDTDPNRRDMFRPADGTVVREQ